MTGRTDLAATAMGWVAVASVGVASAGATIAGASAWSPWIGWSWWACYALYVLGFWLSDARGPWSRLLPPRAAVVALTVLGVTMFLLAPAVGWISILLVVTAVLAADTLQPPGVVLVVSVQTLASAVAGSLAGWDAVTVVMSVLAYGTFQGFAALLVMSAQREEAARLQLAVAHAELRAASVLLAESSRAAERLRISRDLHDVLGHKLTAITLELEIAGHELDGGAGEHAARARDVARELLADVRRTVGELRDAPPDLRDALRDLVSEVPALEVDLAVTEEVPVGADQFRAVVRCVQELVTNSLRHGGATRLHVVVRSARDGVRIEAEDDGGGTDDLVLGNGLTGMRERFTALGGHVDFDSHRGKGFRATGVLPS